MEPIAPGTEDEPLISFSSSSKQEKERERLLSKKALLPSGRYGNVFEFKYINGAEHWYCNACACPVMGWVFHHETGKRHKMALGNSSEDRFPKLSELEEPVIQVAPGEPVPPGFEGQVEKVALIQERLDFFSVGPLVALEYLLELRDYDATKEPNYLCILCDKKGDPRTVLTHLASYKHILQYLQKHFPTCYRALAPYMTKQYKRNWQAALHDIAEAIEKKFGRLKPVPVDADRFEKDQMFYLELIAKGRHFSELSGHTFEEMINKDELTKIHEDEMERFPYQNPAPPKKKSPSPPVVANPIKKIKMSSSGSVPAPATAVGSRRRSLSSVSSITSSDLSDYDETKEKRPYRARPAPPRKRSRSPHGRRFERRSPPPRREEFYRKDDRNLMPWEKSNYRRTKPDYHERNERNKYKSDKVDEFKKLCKAIDTDMERVLKNHKKNPEKHPQYNEEWKKFWNKRYKELQAESKDVSTHDFKPEWIEFWNKRMIELYQDEIKSKKDALRKRLGLEEPSPISFKIGTKKRLDSKESSSNKPIPPSALPDHDPEVIVIDDKDDESKGSKRSHSPWEEEPPPRSVLPKEKSRERDHPALRLSRDKSREREYVSRVSREKSRERDYTFREKSREKDYSSRFSRERSREKDYKKSLERSSKERFSPGRSPKNRTSRDRYERSSRDRSPRERFSPRDRGSRDRFSPRDRGSRERSYERDYKKKSRDHREYRPRERVRVVSELPWNRIEVDYYKPPAVMRDVTRAPVVSPPPATVEEDDGEINVVAVLRHLTALEEKLGSLGPKVVDLLAKALAMEKSEANSSENLLDNEVNCVLFETIKEKLKGQLLAGLVEPIQEKAFKTAIKKSASLVHAAGERKKEKEKSQPKVDPVKVPGVGTVDKAAIARQIANALVLQGKTDVTQAELEQLINAVVGMAEASRKSNKPMTTANFLEQITKPGPSKESTPPPKVESPPPPVVEPPEPPKTPEKPSNSMEGLSDSDLQTLLQNFKDLSTEEQHGLINYLKKLEAHEPDRVERLRKFVNLGPSKPEKVEEKKEVVVAPPPPPVAAPTGRESPFANRSGSLNPTSDTTARAFYDNLDSEDEEYTFEDVAKAASKNVKEKELEKERETKKFDARKAEMNLDDTKALISNIMSNINKSSGSGSQSNLLGLGGNVSGGGNFSNVANSGTKPDNSSGMAGNSNQNNVAKSTGANLLGLGAKDFANIPVNMANLANIVGSVQNMTKPVPPVNVQRSSGVSFGGFAPEPVRFPNYPQRNLGTVPNYGQQNFYQQPQQRQNVSYPIDKNKVSYPNYAGYDQGSNEQQGQRFGNGANQGGGQPFGNVQGNSNEQTGHRFGNGPRPRNNQQFGGNNQYPNPNSNRGGNFRW